MSNEIERMLLQWVEKKKQHMRNEAKQQAKHIEQEMQTNAPWKDDTGNARKGLKAHVVEDHDTIGIDIVHSVEYGVHLEKKGYPIIDPTFRRHKNVLKEIAKGEGGHNV